MAIASYLISCRFTSRFSLLASRFSLLAALPGESRLQDPSPSVPGEQRRRRQGAGQPGGGLWRRRGLREEVAEIPAKGDFIDPQCGERILREAQEEFIGTAIVDTDVVGRSDRGVGGCRLDGACGIDEEAHGLGGASGSSDIEVDASDHHGGLVGGELYRGYRLVHVHELPPAGGGIAAKIMAAGLPGASGLEIARQFFRGGGAGHPGRAV